MLAKIVNLVPRDWLVYLYKHLPLPPRFKNGMVYRSQHKFLVSVLGVITRDDGKVLFLHHVYRDRPWGIPGGWLELEKPEEGLRREIQEETGLQVEDLKLHKALFGTKPNRIDLVYLGKGISGDFRKSSEISQVLYCDVKADQWPEGVSSGVRKLVMEVLQD